MDIRGRFLGRRSPVTVEQGQVPVEMIRLVSRSRNHRAWEISFHSKYPEYFGGGGNTLMFSAGDPTLKCDRNVLPTMVELPIPRGWDTVCEMYGKWTIGVASYRPRRRRYGVLFTDWETGKELRYNRHGDKCDVCGTELALVFGDDYPTFGEDEHGNRFAHLNPHRDDHIPVRVRQEGL